MRAARRLSSIMLLCLLMRAVLRAVDVYQRDMPHAAQSAPPRPLRLARLRRQTRRRLMLLFIR